MLDGVSRCYRSTQHGTPKYEVREVHYPWHPLFGRQVHVHGSLRRLNRDLCLCWLPGQEDRIGFQLPAWMLDRALCASMILRSEPTVNWQALLELKQLLDKTMRSSVATPSVLRQATPITNGGNAHDKSKRHPRNETAQPVRVSHTSSSMGGLTAGGPPSSHPSSLRTAFRQNRAASSDHRGQRRRR